VKDKPKIREGYKGHLLRYKDPARVVARMSERRRERLAVDEEYRQRLRDQNRTRRTPEQHRASEAVRYAIRTGKITKPETCQNCGKTGAIEAAHWDYSRKLDVCWLCRSCHRRWDCDEPKAFACVVDESAGLKDTVG
jgi:hypothetical protein